MNKKLLRDLALALLLVIASVAALIIMSASKTDGDSFEITISGELYGVYSLDTDQVIDIGGKCIVEVSDGEVFMRESNCRDKTCVHMGRISKSGETVICLPNSVVIRVLGESERDFVL